MARHFIGSLQSGSDSFEILQISIAKIFCFFLKHIFLCVAKNKGTLGKTLVPLIVKFLLSKCLP